MAIFFPFTAKTTHPPEAGQLFLKRKYYKLSTSLIYGTTNNNYIDLWYDVPYYGKIDRKGYLIAPRKDKLKYSLNEGLITFDFVGQAFDEAMYFLTRGESAGRTNLGGLLNTFKPARSFVDSEETYLVYASSILEMFNYDILLKGKLVLDFDTYVCKFLKYLFSMPRSFFSYYSIFASFLTSVSSTGLSIDFEILDHDNDHLKNKFYSNDELEKYINTMANFGFRINKNAPWQIIADLNSEPMLKGRKIKSSQAVPKGQFPPATKIDTITQTDGYLPQHFIPDIDFLFKESYSRVMFRTLTLLKNVFYYGYGEYQKRAKYVISYGKPQLKFNPKMPVISFGDVFRPPSAQFFIKNYEANSENTSMHVVKTDLAPFGYTDDYFIKVLEEILKHEYSVKHNRTYNLFKKRFNKSLKRDHYYNTLELLEGFYSPTKIYDPVTKKLLWDIKKNTLTKQQKQNIIPNENKKPTVEKVVSEFFTGN